MLRSFLFLLFLIPILEIYLLMEVGSRMGVVATVLSVLGAAMVGGMVVRHQGVQTLMVLQQRLAQHELPARQIAEGAMLLVAGALLITPGYITDCLGFLLAIPWSRNRLCGLLLRLLSKRVGTPPLQEGVVEGEFFRHPDESP